jgi:o-succinylbenzoate---CoA ligase
MTEVVVLALPAGPAYLEAIQRVWEGGDAIAPLDSRLPKAEADRLLAAIGPAAVIEADGERRRLPGGTPVEPGDALLMATSGTTGEPKVVIHTHAGVTASARATSAALGVDPARDRWLACLPVAHIGGLAVVLRALVTDTPVELHNHFSPTATVEALDRGATLVSLVTRALNQVPVARFRAILLGGAVPPAERPANVIATYGLTETGSGVVYNRRPLPGVEIEIDPAGEIRLRGPMLLRAYRHDPNPLDSNGWFATGDLGRWGEDGLLVVDGRRGDVIITGGEKVWPGPVEVVLGQRPDVAEVAIVGRPDPDWGHRVVAVVVPADPAHPPGLDDLRDEVKASFGPWCAPRELELRADLPRTSLGKIRRHEL